MRKGSRDWLWFLLPFYFNLLESVIQRKEQMKREISGYTVAEELYRSSKKVFFRGVRGEDGKSVIIKTLDSEYPSAQEKARLQYEYQLLKSLDISGVVLGYDFKEYDNNVAIILEDFEGVPLSRYIYEGNGISLDQFFNLAIKVTKTLSLIHQANIIHKDIKPENIFWNPDKNEINFVDFGLATQLSRERQITNIASIFEDSLPYISPEQTGRMNREIDYRSDFYSLGVTFFEFLTRSLPFTAEDAMGWVHCHIAKSPLAPAKKLSGIPAVISDIILKLISKNAEDRYQSSYGIIRDLEECQEQWERNNSIERFQTGQWDLPEKFQVPQKLYGREEETDVLLKSFEKVSRGNTEITLVAGYSGIGKSLLVHEMHRPIVREHGYFIEGKHDQFQANIPYSGIIQAFKMLAQQLLSEPADRLEQWKNSCVMPWVQTAGSSLISYPK